MGREFGVEPFACYEVWNRVNVRGLMGSRGTRARGLLTRVSLVEMSQPVLARALEPFPVGLRTLDALHLATAEYLRQQGESVELPSYDGRLIAAAQAIGIPIAALCPIAAL